MAYFLLYGVFALWVLYDGLSRRMGASAILWTVGTAVVGPIVLPIYLALRPLKQGEVREGGKAWNVLKNFAILWTIVMLIGSVAALMAMAKGTTGLTSDAARAGAGIGMLLGIGILGAAWFFPTMGAALLGFLLKKNTIVENGPTGPLVGQSSAANVAGGWGGLAGVAVVGLIVVGVVSSSTKGSSTEAGSAPGASTASAPTAALDTTENEWALIESTNKMDSTPEVVLRKSGSNGSSLTIRCSDRKTDAYVNTDTVVDNGAVRVRFDQAGPVRQMWTRSTDYKALFAPDGISFARQLAKAQSFLFEFTPFQEGARAVSFEVSGLDVKLPKLAEACGWSDAQVAARNEQRRTKELEHQRQWRLHVDVRPTSLGYVRLHFSSDGASEIEESLDSDASKHIDGNEVVRLEIDWPEEPSQVRVTVNGQVWPTSNWRVIKDPTIGDLGPVGSKYVTEIAAH